MARRGKRGAPAAVTLLAGVVAVAAAFIIGQSSDSFGLAVSSGFGRQALVASAVSEAARETGSAQNGGSSPRGDDAFVEVSGQLQRPTSPSVSPSPQANGAAIEPAATPITTSPLIDRPVVSIGTPASITAPTTTTTTTTTIQPSTTVPSVQVNSDDGANEDASASSGISTPERALAELGIDLAGQLPGWTLSFESPRSGMKGTAFPYEKRIEIYVRDNFSRAELLHVVAHEIGHALDVTYLDDAKRARWAEARGYSGRQWWTGNGQTDFSVGAGDWAECYAWSRLGYGPWYSNLGDQPGAELTALMYELIG